MLEEFGNSEVSVQQVRMGPDLFGFYKREIIDLLNKDEGFLETSSRTEQDVDVSSRLSENSNVGDLFSNSLGDAVVGVKKELLNASMRQGVKALSEEVDEMIDPCMRIRHIISSLTSKKQQSGGKALLDRDSSPPTCKKQKISSNRDSELLTDQNGDADKETGQVDEDLKMLLDNEDIFLLEEAITKHSTELDVMLNDMEKKLEELLNAVVSKCRLMTRQEKQQLGKLIQKLPPRNLHRIVEIIHRSQSSDATFADEIFVDLEKQENATLWRLYFYVKTVENARNLST